MAFAGSGRRKRHGFRLDDLQSGIRSTGLMTSPERDASNASFTRSSGNVWISRSYGNRPCLFSVISALISDDDRPSPPSDADHPLAPQRGHVIERERRPGGRAADQRDGAAHADRVGRLPQHRDVAGAVEAEVGRPAADLVHRSHRVGAGDDTSIVSVAPSSRASASRDASRSTAMIDVAAGQPGRHHRGQPDRPGPVDDDGRAGPRPQRVQHRARPGRDPAGERPEQRHVGVRVHCHEGVRRADRVRRERRLAEEVAVQRRPVQPPQRRRPVRPPAAQHQRPEIDRQYRGCPSRQFRQDPHHGQPITTLSPTATLVTPAPTAATIPAPSCPSTPGAGNGMSPSRAIASVWQTPDATIWTSTSPGPGESTSTSVTLSGVNSFSKTAAAARILTVP